MQGAEPVLTTVNGALRGREDTIEASDFNRTLRLIDAAKQAGVRRFVYTYGIGP